jgi:hypothetical protein
MTIISMNENDIKKIVEELCATDRTLRGKERELTELVRKLAVKPNVERDPDFLRTLRTQLIAELSAFHFTLLEFCFLGSRRDPRGVRCVVRLFGSSSAERPE